MSDPTGRNSPGYGTDDPRGVSESNSNTSHGFLVRHRGSRRLVPKRIRATRRNGPTTQAIRAGVVHGIRSGVVDNLRPINQTSISISRSPAVNNAGLAGMTTREIMNYRNTMRRNGKLTQNLNTRIVKLFDLRVEKNRAGSIKKLVTNLQSQQEEAAAHTKRRSGGARTFRRSRGRSRGRSRRSRKL
jgi:hypothetical protein